jgi:polysaccharide export outer membrane protein
MRRACALTLTLALTLAMFAGCAPQGPFPVGAAPEAATPAARLAPGERLRITTFGEPTLTGEFTVGADGGLAFPLIGAIPASGKTPRELAGALREALLAQGYLTNPNVAVEVLAYRPFYVLGEVNQPGEFPYQPGLTVLAAVARAQGFTYRARQSRVFIKRAGEAEEREVPLTSDLVVGPGDIVRIGERYF